MIYGLQQSVGIEYLRILCINGSFFSYGSFVTERSQLTSQIVWGRRGGGETRGTYHPLKGRYYTKRMEERLKVYSSWIITQSTTLLRTVDDTYKYINGTYTYIVSSSWSSSFSIMSTYATVVQHPNNIAFFYQHEKDIMNGMMVPNNNNAVVMMNIPFVGQFELDTVFFTTSAILFRLYMMVVSYRSWRKRRTIIGVDDDDEDGGRDRHITTTDDDNNNDNIVVKATIIGGYKDPGLYQTMKECMDVRLKLRRVADPDIVRRKKKEQIKKAQRLAKAKAMNTNDNRGIIDESDNCDGDHNGRGGYLGMSPLQLQSARNQLKQVGGG